MTFYPNKKCFYTLVLASFLISCSNSPKNMNQNIPNNHADRQIDIYKLSIAQSAFKIKNAWTDLASNSKLIQRTKHSRPSMDNAPPELTQMVSIDWISGPIKPVLKSIATKTGWELIELGTKPPIEQTVTISGTYAAIRAIEIVGSQSTAHVGVDVESKNIILDWGY